MRVNGRFTVMNHSDSMCDTCRYLKVVKGNKESEEIRSCQQNMFPKGMKMFEGVRECSSYTENNDAVWTMEEKAYILVTGKDGSKKFLSSEENKAYERQREMEGEDE